MPRAALTLVAVLLWAGCFQSDTVVRVRPDGSGTIEQTFTMSKAAVAQMRALSAEMGDGDDKFTLMEVEKLKAQAAAMGEGVRFVSAEPLSGPDGEGYRAVYAFDDVTALRLDPGGPDLEDGAATPPENPVTFAFAPGTPARLTIRQPTPPEPDSAQTAQQAQQVDMMTADSTAMEALGQQAAALFEGMRIRMAVEPEGDIAETSATYQDDGAVVLFDVDMGALLDHPDKLAALQVSGAKAPAEMQEILADIPGLRIEAQETVTVVFE